MTDAEGDVLVPVSSEQLSGYMMDNSKFAEQFNTLIVIDEAIGKSNLSVRPRFEILGGTGLLFHGIGSIYTIDIDVANRLSEEVRNIVDPLISDMASEVVHLPSNYTERLIPFKQESFKNIDVYLLSLEDLIISKLLANRDKDIDDLTKTEIPDRCDFNKLTTIINSELKTDVASGLLIKVSKLF